jgi:hypothetical protein
VRGVTPDPNDDRWDSMRILAAEDEMDAARKALIEAGAIKYETAIHAPP